MHSAAKATLQAVSLRSRPAHNACRSCLEPPVTAQVSVPCVVVCIDHCAGCMVHS